jgi:hypothetical protein
MSLTSFLNMPEVTAKVKPLRPKLPRKIVAPLKAEPLSNRYMLVGTAFDYFLRFELQRRAPHAIADRWVAEYAPDIIWRKTDKGAVGMDLLMDDLTDAASVDYMPPEQVAECFRRILADAKAAVAAFTKSKVPSREMQADLPGHAIRLAKLDFVYRAMRLDPRFREANAEDVQDLVNLLSIVPFETLLHKTSLILNPNFGDSSILVGGADTDLIAGNLLVDFKTTKKGEMAVRDLDQLLGYFFLASKQRQSDPGFPAIERLGLYFCRHGYLWTLEASVWTEHPQFSEIELWFFNRAKEVFGQGKLKAKTGNSR